MLNSASDQDCTDRYGYSYDGNLMLCAIGDPGDPAKDLPYGDTCQGDSGSALLRSDTSTPTIAGVVSYGGACGSGVAVYARADDPWLRAVVADLSLARELPEGLELVRQFPTGASSGQFILRNQTGSDLEIAAITDAAIERETCSNNLRQGNECFIAFDTATPLVLTLTIDGTNYLLPAYKRAAPASATLYPSSNVNLVLTGAWQASDGEALDALTMTGSGQGTAVVLEANDNGALAFSLDGALARGGLLVQANGLSGGALVLSGVCQGNYYIPVTSGDSVVLSYWGNSWHYVQLGHIRVEDPTIHARLTENSCVVAQPTRTGGFSFGAFIGLALILAACRRRSYSH